MRKALIFLMIASLLAIPSFAQRNRGLAYHEVQVVDLNGRRATDISEVHIWNDGTTTNQTIYADRGLSDAITLPMTTASTNTTLSNGKFSWWGPPTYDFQVSNGTVKVNNSNAAVMNASQGRIVFPYFASLPYPANIATETHSANDTMDTAADVGTWHLVDTNGVTITLPAVATGLEYKIMNIGVNGAVEVHVDVNASDKVLGGSGLTALDDGDKLTNTKATARYGDYVIYKYGTAVGWYVTDKVGTWADGG